MPRSIIPPYLRGGYSSARFPSVDPETLEIIDAPPHGQPFPQPSPEDLDDLYLSEARQFSELAGLREVEAGLLHDLEPLGPDPVLYGDDFCDLVVDESKWIKPMQRNRWIGYDRPIPGTDLTWDPTDDRFWNVFRYVLELANRLILHSLTSKWVLSTTHVPAGELLRNVYLYRNGQRDFENVLRIREVDGTETSPEAALEVFNSLANNHLNSFLHLSGCYGVTHCFGRRWVSGYQFLVLDCHDTQILFQEKKYSKVLRRQVLYQVARTYVHEMMHVLHHQIGYKMHVAINAPKMEWQYPETDLYYGDEKWSEAGCSHSLAIFRGESQQHVGKVGVDAVNFAFFSLEMPALGGSSETITSYSKDPGEDFEEREGAYENFTRCIPALWADAHVRESFWTWMSAKPVEALLTPNLFTARQMISPDLNGRTWRAKVVTTETVECPPGLQEYLVKIAENIKAYRNKVNLLRKPWYRDTLAVWQMTPYSDENRRYILDLIVKAQKIPSQDNEYEIWKHIHSLGCQLPDKRSDLVIPRFYEALANLIEAAIPVSYGSTELEPLPAEEGDPFGPKDHPYRPNHTTPSLLLHRFTEEKVFPEIWEEKRERHMSDRQRTLHHRLKGTSEPSHNQQISLYHSKVSFDLWSSTAAIPAGLTAEFTYAWRTAKVALDMDPSSATWHHFDFEMPPYSGVISQAADWKALLNSREYEGSDIGSVEGYAGAGLAQLLPPDALPLRYYTVGEVGDRQSGATSNWLGLRPVQGSNEIAVYDISSILEIPGAEVSDVLEANVSHQVGRMVRDQMPRRLAEEFRKLKPIGLVMLERRLSEVHANNGRDGKDRWMMIGHHVYDVTACLKDIEIDDDLARSIERAVGINPAAQLLRQDHHAQVILEELSRHRIGMVRAELEHPRRQDRIFTLAELAWHQNPEAGMYVSIGNFVYDVTDYAEWHPGGKLRLSIQAGGPIDELWEVYHGDDEIAEEQLEKLCIGRIVPEHYADERVPGGHIALGDYVYDVQSLETSPNAEHRAMWAAAKQLYGLPRRLIQIMLVAKTPRQPLLDLNRLLHQPDMRHLIVSKLGRRTKDLPVLGQWQLARYNGEEEPMGGDPSHEWDGNNGDDDGPGGQINQMQEDDEEEVEGDEEKAEDYYDKDEEQYYYDDEEGGELYGWTVQKKRKAKEKDEDEDEGEDEGENEDHDDEDEEGRPNLRWADTWVAVSPWVFNVSSLIRHPWHHPIAATIERMAGQEINGQDQESADAAYTLVMNYRHLIVARYTSKRMGDMEFQWKEPWRGFIYPDHLLQVPGSPQISELANTPLSSLTPDDVLVAPILDLDGFTTNLSPTMSKLSVSPRKRKDSGPPEEPPVSKKRQSGSW